MNYEIRIRGRQIYSGDSENDFLDVLEELAEEYYNTGDPSPEDIETNITE
tara:strand:+ start:408 stop:557 length:150 start_codon:yes stop_codon:yes gene_type:complete